MTRPHVKFRVSSHIDAAVIRGVTDRHPRLKAFYRTVGEHAGQGDHRARSLLDFVVRRMLDDVGDLHLNDVFSRLDRIEVLRDNIAAVLDHVLEGGDLPKGVHVATLGQYFEHLQKEMHDLTEPREALIGEKPFKLTDDSAEYAHQLLDEFRRGEGAGPPGGGAHGEPVERMLARFRDLPDDQRSALGRAGELAPGELWRTVAAESGSARTARMAKLRERLHGKMTEAELASLETAIGELGKARTRGRTGIAGRGEAVLAGITDPALRLAVAADPWVLQEVRSAEQLQSMWNNYQRRGGDPGGFRAYVRREMMTYARSVFGEQTAAFSLPEIDFFLKGPDIHTRRPGTDLVGIGHDGWVWVVDDKSHKASSVSSVSALFENLVGNLRDDARQFREDIARLRREVPGFRPDMRALDGIERMQRAADEIDAHLQSLPAAQRFQQASLARIDAILKRHEIKLRVTSAFGEVTAISADLARLGIRVTPTGPVVPLP